MVFVPVMVFGLKDPLDLVDRWSVLGRLKYLTQYSYWPKGWGKLTVRALGGRGGGLQTSVTSLSELGFVVKALLQQSTRITIFFSSNRLKRLLACQFLAQGAKGGRSYSFLVLRRIVSTEEKGPPTIIQ